jgi:hypothetical protein
MQKKTEPQTLIIKVTEIKAKQWLVERNLVQNERRDIEADADYADGGEDGMSLEFGFLQMCVKLAMMHTSLQVYTTSMLYLIFLCSEFNKTHGKSEFTSWD